MKPNSLQELYKEQLKGLYDAEHQIIEALPKIIEAATSKSLKDALWEHLNITKQQVLRLEQIFKTLGEEPKGERCKGMKGVLEEGSDLVDNIRDANVRDAAIIVSAQRVEHYEMAGYGTVGTYAALLGDNDASALLDQTLGEEKEADHKLTTIAGKINLVASAGKRTGEESAKPRRAA
jgi:ferritin-like metal-binding protein YciE